MNLSNYTTLNEIYDAVIETTDAEKIALCFNGKKISYGELAKSVDDYSKHLVNLGVKKGSVVGYSLPNCPEVFYLFFALSKLGAPCVPLYQMVPDMGKASIFTKSRVELVVTSSKQFDSLNDAKVKTQSTFRIATIDNCNSAEYSFLPELVRDVSLKGNEASGVSALFPLMITSSSGTTGIPKAIILTHINAVSSVKIAIEMAKPFEQSENESYSSVIAFPLSTSGILVCCGIMFSGVTLIFSDNMYPQHYLEMISTWKPQAMSAPPAYFEGILNLPGNDSIDTKSIKKIMTGMDFFSPSLLARLKQRFPNISTAVNGYGLMETSTIIMLWKGLDEEALTGATNTFTLVNESNEIDVRNQDGVSVGAGEEGELFIKGPSVINGYPNNVQETQSSFIDGWFKTGDHARKENNKTITLLGRNKYLIKRGGKTVSPVVVQNHINLHQAVLASAVIGVPHPLYGEMIWAFIVNKPTCELSFKEIMKHCRDGLVNYMVPDQITFINEIPKNPGVGKIDMEKLKTIAREELEKISGAVNG